MWKWILGIIVFALVIKYWVIALVGLALVLLLIHIGRNAATDPGPLKPLRKTARKPAPKLKPAAELPAPEYLPRWTASRHMSTGREHDQWQREFDRS